jgi:hypothetical protein
MLLWPVGEAEARALLVVALAAIGRRLSVKKQVAITTLKHR